ncbi:autotransporter domain-containing protein [Brucella anthropi]|uniref:autotransporter domain-containing protein n=1 Tax=Brucella anthropi TaxID=529 RepID=UPI00244823D0|nr:autotransporter domain-containing protein [Brucella anthropi]MDG9793535.1 autotransporter domain-containing protein [Brucella anthropi]MDH0583352.1 autotransporter domain-containing protein [Brucella anthropi]MDH0819936.1 autotransporter domain-containing protein [Brucella anthropi]MDH2086727.1 autotransporter domain-containing protein [Brucella anthropi]
MADNKRAIARGFGGVTRQSAILYASTAVAVVATSWFAVLPAKAQVIWQGDINDDFNNGGNWSSGVVPTDPGAVGVFDSTGMAQTLRLTGSVNLGGLEFTAGAPGYSLSINGPTLGIYSGLINNSGQVQTININSGSLQLANGAGIGQLLINNGALLQFDGSSDASGATVVNNNTVGLRGLFGASTLTIGSLSGAGNLVLADNAGHLVTVGALGLDDTFSGAITPYDAVGNGALTKVGTGTLTLSGNSNYSGGTTISAGTIRASGDKALGNGQVTLGGGTLALTGARTIGNAINLSATGTIRFDTGANGTLSGDITTNGKMLTLNAIGTATLNGHINGSTSYIGKSGSGTMTVNGVVSGAGAGISVGAGTLVLNNANTFGGGSGSTVIGNATLVVGNDQALSTSRLSTNSAGSVLSVNKDVTLANNASLIGGFGLAVDTAGHALEMSGTFQGIAGQGTITKLGIGILTLSGNNSGFGGDATVSTGTLLINGNFGGSATVEDGGTLIVGDANHSMAYTAGNIVVDTGGTLGGIGAIGGEVDIHGTLSAGNSPGTLTINNDLRLHAGSISVFELNSPGIIGGNGAAGNDLVMVNGALTLGGTLDAHVAAAGYYRLFDYSGALSGAYAGGQVTGTGGFATLAPNAPDIRYDIPGQINLSVLGAGQAMQFWDGGNNVNDGVVDGGSGIWQSYATNWTDSTGSANSGWGNSVGVFTGTAGTVTVSGPQLFDTLQFSTDGYVVTGDALDIAVAEGSTFNVNGGVTASVGSIIQDKTGTALRKAGSGTLVLKGNNTYSGGTSLLGGVASVSSDSNLGSVTGGLSFDGGVLQITGTTYTSTTRAITLEAGGGGFDIADAANSFTLAQGIGGSGDLVKQGEGTLILAGTNAYGNTLVQAGTLTGNIASISGNIGSAATLVFDQAANGNFAGSIAGLNGLNGSMIKRGAGMLTLNGTSSLDWTIETGGLTTAAERFGGNVNLWAGTTLAFNQSQTASYAGILAGSGDMTVTGNGAVTLTGDSSAFTGTTTVTGGRLIVGTTAGGKLGGSVMIGSGGMLGGTGDVSSATESVTVASGGIHAPGNSIGVQTVLGDYVNHGTLRIEVTPMDADRIRVAGSVDVTDATLELVLSPITASSWGAFNGPFTIIDKQSVGAVTGTFSTIVQDLLFLNASLAYDGGDGNDVTVALDRNDVSFASVGLTRNQIATGEAVESLGSSNMLWASIALISDPGIVRASFDALSGEIHASAKTALIEDSRFVRNVINDRIRAAFDTVGASDIPVLAYGTNDKPAPVSADYIGPVFWSQGFGSWGSTGSDSNAAHLERSTGGVLVGADGLVGDWRVGLLAGYSHSRFDTEARMASGESDNYHLGLYGGTQWGDLALRTGAAYSWHNIDTSRGVVIPGIAESPSADYHAGTFQAFGDFGYGIDRGRTRFEPFANLAYVSLHSDRFAEQGGTAALNGGSSTTDVTFATLGLRAEQTLMLDTISTTLRGMAGWRHAFGDTTPTSTQAFLLGDIFTIAGVPITRDAAVIEVGLDLNLTSKATLGLSYTGQIATDAQDHGFRTGLNVRF